MEKKIKKCSSKDHEELNASFYCPECKIYLCNKCEVIHSKLLKNHRSYNLDKDIADIFTGFCNEENHFEKLDYFCRNHNKLCCASCIVKFKNKGKGQHTDCDICILEDIKDEKNNKLQENIKILEELSNTIEESIKQLKEISDKINQNKEELKKRIQNIFTKIRNAVNEREDQIILEVDKRYEEIYFNEELIKKSEKLPIGFIKFIQRRKIILKLNHL